MNEAVIQAAALIGAAIAIGIAIFQMLLLAGLPLGAYSWGGRHEGVLPLRLRWMSLPSAVLLLLIALIILSHANVIAMESTWNTSLFIWIIVVFLGLNTLGNLASKSKKEKAVMTPLAGIAFACCLIVAIWGGQ